MTLPVFPPELPRPSRQGYQVALGDGRTKRREDAGPPNVRRRFSAVADMVSLQITVTRAGLARFQRFYDEELGKGSRPFLMPDPGSDGWALLTDEGDPLLTEEGAPILVSETWICIIGQTPAWVPVGVEWRVSFDVAVMP